MLRARILVSIIILAALSAPLVYAQSEPSSLMAQLLSKNPLNRQAAADNVMKQRQETIRDLISITEKKDVDKTFGGPYHRAIILLGDLRATEAVGVLSANLTYLPGGCVIIDEVMETQAYYPCAFALTRIGEPAIPAMIGRITQGSTPLERELAAWVVMEIEGKDQAAYRFASLGKTDMPGRNKDMLATAERFVKDYKPAFDYPGMPKDLDRPNIPGK
jgi:hypothetical protein